MRHFFTACLLLAAASSFALDQHQNPAWTDSDKAAHEVENYELIGEHLSHDKTTAAQAALLKDDQFLVAVYQGGLPGDGWDEGAISSRLLTADELRDLLKNYTKVLRESPVLGKQPPEEAALIFPSDFTNVKDGLLQAGGKTAKDLGSFKMHIEFMLPLKPKRNPSDQDRGNSGIYIFNNYEIQVIDSFALDLNTTNNAIKTATKNTQWCGALYKMKTPDVHMVYPPLRWQTYDIEFTAPEFEGAEKVKNARITIYHNGVLIHDDIELLSGTGLGGKRKQLTRGPIYFQNHGSPVIYRNVWAVELE